MEEDMEISVLEEIYNYRSVSPSLSTGGQPSEDEIKAVARAGFQVVINLALHDDPRYSLPDEAALVRSLGMEYVHIPVLFDNPTEGDLRLFFEAMHGHNGKKSFLHCAANMRVSTFLGLYRVIGLGWERERAFALMREIWEPDGVWSRFIEEMLQRFSIGSKAW